jgi:hypothetical protein
MSGTGGAVGGASSRRLLLRDDALKLEDQALRGSNVPEEGEAGAEGVAERLCRGAPSK